MALTGGCYCGDVRYEAEGEPILKAQCHCRECMYFTGGAPNLFLLLPPEGFRFTKGEPKTFTRPDLENAVTRSFCGSCGSQLLTRRSDYPFVILKAGTLDDPSAFGGAQIAIFAVDRLPFHTIPEGIPVHDRLPPPS